MERKKIVSKKETKELKFLNIDKEKGIVLTDNFFIDTDERCYILNQRYISTEGKKKGEYINKVIGYYNTLPSALNGFLKHLERQKIYTREAKNVKDLIKKMETIHDNIVEALK